MLRRIVQNTSQIFETLILKTCFSHYYVVRNQEKQTSGEDCEKDRRDGFPAREKASTRSTRINFSSVPNWTLDEYRHECESLLNVKRFDAMAVDETNLGTYDYDQFGRDTALCVRKRR